MILPAELALHRVADMGISLPDADLVKTYLARYPDTADAAVEVCDLARGLFPSGTRLRLVVYQDPEIDDEYLALYARPPQFDSSSYPLFRTAQQRRVPIMQRASGRLMILPDFITAE
jgi:hypothetical protein